MRRAKKKGSDKENVKAKESDIRSSRKGKTQKPQAASGSATARR